MQVYVIDRSVLQCFKIHKQFPQHTIKPSLWDVRPRVLQENKLLACTEGCVLIRLYQLLSQKNPQCQWLNIVQIHFSLTAMPSSTFTNVPGAVLSTLYVSAHLIPLTSCEGLYFPVRKLRHISEAESASPLHLISQPLTPAPYLPASHPCTLSPSIGEVTQHLSLCWCWGHRSPCCHKVDMAVYSVLHICLYGDCIAQFTHSLSDCWQHLLWHWDGVLT